MGCCFSSPILEDDSIIAHLRVRPYIALRGVVTFKNGAPGLLYTDGTNLYYEGTCGDKRACCLGCRQNIPLSSISTIVSSKKPTVVSIRRGQRHMLPAPSLRLTGKVDGVNFIVCVSTSSINEMDQFVRFLETQLQSKHVSFTSTVQAN